MDRILNKALQLENLSTEDVQTLLDVKDPILVNKIFDTALKVKNKIYGNRIVFFAPLYVSNKCVNNCLYCSFRNENNVSRIRLSQTEIEKDTQALLKQGHKRLLMVAGEESNNSDYLEFIIDSIRTIYSARYQNNNIRRINVNIAPLETEDFKKLKETKIGTYQLFQETYHRETYKKMHPSGPKSDYDYRYTAIDRAMKAGIDDVGIGVLFGLYDWRYEIIALLDHIHYLEKTYGVGPHTISVPRIEPAQGSELSFNPPYRVSDDDFKKIVAILRLAVPYTGIIISTRESAAMRREILQLGASQMSAGSKTNPGGYSDCDENVSQFSVGDNRNLEEIIDDLLDNDFLPSFCTACYRLGRTGHNFMEYAKPGNIKLKCQPNALVTLKEYLQNFASPELKKKGEKKIKEWLSYIKDNDSKKSIIEMLNSIEKGQSDLYE